MFFCQIALDCDYSTVENVLTYEHMSRCFVSWFSVMVGNILRDDYRSIYTNSDNFCLKIHGILVIVGMKSEII